MDESLDPTNRKWQAGGCNQQPEEGDDQFELCGTLLSVSFPNLTTLRCHHCQVQVIIACLGRLLMPAASSPCCEGQSVGGRGASRNTVSMYNYAFVSASPLVFSFCSHAPRYGPGAVCTVHVSLCTIHTRLVHPRVANEMMDWRSALSWTSCNEISRTHHGYDDP